MLNTHGFMPASASVAGAGTAVGLSAQGSGAAATTFMALGIALLVLTIIFALAAIRGLLPRRRELRQRRGGATPIGLTQRSIAFVLECETIIVSICA